MRLPVAAVAAGLLLTACCRSNGCLSPSPTPSATPLPPTPVAAASGGGGQPCMARGLLPDPRCTPGATDPRVTQATIATTICITGYTAKVRPPSAYTDELKRQGIALYAYTDHRPGSYEEDHLIPLEVGGDGANPFNLWPEPLATAHRKDATENAAHAAVCAGRMTLAAAQAGFATDWTALARTLGAAP